MGDHAGLWMQTFFKNRFLGAENSFVNGRLVDYKQLGSHAQTLENAVARYGNTDELRKATCRQDSGRRG